VKQYLGGNRFKDDLEVERTVKRWLTKKDTDRYKQGEVKRGLYKENDWESSTIKYELFLLMKIKNPVYRVIRNDCRGFNNLPYTIHLR
jgi:hypothetical protein